MKRSKDEEYDPEREEKILEQIKLSGRKKIAPPGKFHSEKVRPNNKRERRKNMKDIARDWNRTHSLDDE